MIEEAMLVKMREVFGNRLQENVRMANFATMNVGGPADALLIATSADELADMVKRVWEMNLPVKVLGSGSNLLVSDKGIRAVVVINHAHTIRVNLKKRSHYSQG